VTAAKAQLETELRQLSAKLDALRTPTKAEFENSLETVEAVLRDAKVALSKANETLILFSKGVNEFKRHLKTLEMDETKHRELRDYRHAKRNLLNKIMAAIDILTSGFEEGEIKHDTVVEMIALLQSTMPTEILDLGKFEKSSRNVVVRVTAAAKALGKSPEWLDSILVNMIQNAEKNPHPDRALEVEIDYDPATRVLTVKDNGSGIPPEIAEQIGKGDIDGTDGSGEGLNNAYKIVTGRGGKIGFKTGGEGTKFSIKLPEDSGTTAAPKTGLADK
jgi:signal transduction histidine kinase